MKKVILFLLVALFLVSTAYAANNISYSIPRVSSAQAGSKALGCTKATMASLAIRLHPSDENGKPLSEKFIIDYFRKVPPEKSESFDFVLARLIDLLNKDKNNRYNFLLYEDCVEEKGNRKRCEPTFVKKNVRKWDKGSPRKDFDVKYIYPYSPQLDDFIEIMNKVKNNPDSSGFMLSLEYAMWDANQKKIVFRQGHSVTPHFLKLDKEETKNGEPFVMRILDGEGRGYAYYLNKFFYYDPYFEGDIPTYLYGRAFSLKWFLLTVLFSHSGSRVVTFLYVERIPLSIQNPPVEKSPKKPSSLAASEAGHDPRFKIRFPMTIFQLARCGNGVIDPGEECDNGVLNGFTAECSPQCTLTYCGDGYLQLPNGYHKGGKGNDGYEICDDGNNKEDDKCSNKCTWTYCGDGIVQNPNGKGLGGKLNVGKEECDDGNKNEKDECSSKCTLTYCGDGVVQKPNGKHEGGKKNDGVEECDDGLQGNDITKKCTPKCTLTYCGDGHVQKPNGYLEMEACDDGNKLNNDKCNDKCQLTYCGDGIRQYPNGHGMREDCDGDDLSGCPVNGWTYKCNAQCDCVKQING